MVQASAPPPVSHAAARSAVVRYAVSEFPSEWIIPEEPVPESVWHDRCLALFRALLDEWITSTKRDAAAFRDIAIRVRREDPRVGFNPDVCLFEPAPAQAAELDSVRLWEHAPPRLCFEAVSPNHPYKDYGVTPEKCALVGVEELCVFDPLHRGATSHGGRNLLQIWRQTPEGIFDRVPGTGDEPVYSIVLGAWLIPDRTWRTLRIAGREDGGEPWLTAAERAGKTASISVEQARAALEREQAALEREGHARRDEALARAHVEAALEREARAEQRETEAKQRETEAKQRETEAKQRETEAKQREADALRRVAELEAELGRRR